LLFDETLNSRNAS